ncbi:hypothetical protein CRENBAI_009176 [Crenichthys baileyi]|uniref:Secreted protein n=1 Tax=Crenichthys baileyi TaxID=28760 RepID=A0AAV9SL67_9TELE
MMMLCVFGACVCCSVMPFCPSILSCLSNWVLGDILLLCLFIMYRFLFAMGLPGRHLFTEPHGIKRGANTQVNTHVFFQTANLASSCSPPCPAAPSHFQHSFAEQSSFPSGLLPW